MASKSETVDAEELVARMRYIASFEKHYIFYRDKALHILW
jgi:hypothetical protein